MRRRPPCPASAGPGGGQSGAPPCALPHPQALARGQQQQQQPACAVCQCTVRRDVVGARGKPQQRCKLRPACAPARAAVPSACASCPSCACWWSLRASAPPLLYCSRCIADVPLPGLHRPSAPAWHGQQHGQQRHSACWCHQPAAAAMGLGAAAGEHSPPARTPSAGCSAVCTQACQARTVPLHCSPKLLPGPQGEAVAARPPTPRTDQVACILQCATCQGGTSAPTAARCTRPPAKLHTATLLNPGPAATTARRCTSPAGPTALCNVTPRGSSVRAPSAGGKLRAARACMRV